MTGEKGRIVRRGTLLFWLVIAGAALMAFEFLSGIILWFVVPSGQGGGLSGSAVVWGLDRHTWIDLHNWAALMLTAVVVAHVALHWKWVVRQLRAYVTGAKTSRTRVEVPSDTA